MFQYLYLSRLAPGFDFSIFKPIVGIARQRNPRAGIGGALLFDGERFCQLLEGPEAAVRDLMKRIEQDTRHVQLVLLHAATAGDAPIRPAWTSGYCGTDELDIFSDEPGLRGPAALTAFAAILAHADLSD